MGPREKVPGALPTYWGGRREDLRWGEWASRPVPGGQSREWIGVIREGGKIKPVSLILRNANWRRRLSAVARLKTDPEEVG